MDDPLDHARSLSAEVDLRDRFLGCLIGGAGQDAWFGWPDVPQL
jgi:hypothetical protein